MVMHAASFTRRTERDPRMPKCIPTTIEQLRGKSMHPELGGALDYFIKKHASKVVADEGQIVRENLTQMQPKVWTS